MSYWLIELFSYSILIPAIYGLVRLRTVDRAYFPFIILLWLGVTNEIVNTIVINRGLSNAINDNIYSIAEILVVCCFFYRLQLFNQKQWLFQALLFFFIVAWVIINFFIFSITVFSSYFNVLSSLAIVLMSVHHITWLLINGRKRLLKEASFLIALCFISFFTYKMLIEIFWIYGLNAGKEFRVQVYRLLTYINLSVNLVFFIAVLWMPRRREYILL